MTVWNRILLCLSICCLLLGCVGCAAQPETPPPSPTPTVTPAPTPEPTPEPTPDPATLPQPDFYTLRLACDAIPLCWNPHCWESEADGLLVRSTVSPLFDLRPEETENGQQAVFVPEMARSVEDATAECAEQFGISPAETGRVWRIRLNPDARWNDEAQTPVTADDYVYSMQMLLDPKLRNYRAEAFRSGPAALSGADAYFNSGAEDWVENAPDGSATYPYAEWVFDRKGNCAAPDGTKLWFSLRQPLDWLQGYSLFDYHQAGYLPEEVYSALAALADAEGFLPVTEKSADLLYSFTGSESWGRESREQLERYAVYRRSWQEVGWESVGFRKEDDHTLLYLTAEATTEFDLCYLLTAPFLVYRPVYEAETFDGAGLSFTDYATSPETSVSCGPYALASAEGTLFTLERNPSWYGYADGRHTGEYQTDRIELRAQSESRAWERFFAGELDILNASDAEGATRLFAPDGYVERFFLVTESETLEALQEAAGKNINKTCLANAAFREALALSIDRVGFAAAEDCAEPALGLIGGIYYDSLNPISRYRAAPEAKRALCSAYGTNANAYDALLRSGGFDYKRASRLFRLACEQMAADGSWQDETTVELRCAVTDGELTETLLRQNEIVQAGLDRAAAGTPLEGKLKLTFCSCPDRYSAVAEGKIEMGLGAWGAAAFDPYSLLRCYCDPTFVTVQEKCGFNPSLQLLTLLVDGTPVTMTYAEWSRSLLDGGSYADDAALRRSLLAKLEDALLREHRCIPVCETGEAVCVSRRLLPGAAAYDPLCPWGGLRTLRYAYDDAQWVAECSPEN